MTRATAVFRGPFAVVGPSGAGKDTLIAAVARARPDIHVARRTVTRPAVLGDEPFEPCSTAAFLRRRAEGLFALDWEAHGLHYGVPMTMEAELAAGRPVLFNGSRAGMDQARMRYPDLHILWVTAEMEILTRRLVARGREDPDDIAARLARAGLKTPEGPEVTLIDNSGPLECAVEAMLAVLQPKRG